MKIRKIEQSQSSIQPTNDMMAKEESTAGDTENYTARSYQKELLEHVMKRNSIICMGTGTGKTYIAIMLIKEKAYEICKPFDEGGKRTFFLVNQVALARQQGDVICKHTNFKTGVYIGADGVDDWMNKPERWYVEFRKCQILVMTARILLDILTHGILPFSRINLLIFDECHNAKKDHPFAKIMDYGRESDCPKNEFPHILGLTASILDKNAVSEDVLQRGISDLEIRLNSTVITSMDSAAIEKYGTKAEDIVIECDEFLENLGVNDKSRKLSELMENILNKAIHFLDVSNWAYERKKEELLKAGAESVEQRNQFLTNTLTHGILLSRKELDDCKVILYELGPVAADFVAEDSIKRLLKEAKNPAEPRKINQRFIRLGTTILQQVRIEYELYYEQHIQCLEDLRGVMSPKVNQLVDEILMKYSYMTTDMEVDSGQGLEEDVDSMECDFNGESDEDSIANEMDESQKEEEQNELESDEDELSNVYHVNIGDEDEDDIAEGLDKLALLKSSDNVPKLTGIVFVERRVTAFALHKVIEQVCSWNHKLAFISSSYIVGGGGKGDTTECPTKRQEETLRKFRDKKLNLLFSTSVLQEGIDIPQCNMVALFNTPKTYREYVQAKGRARAQESHFYIIVTENELNDALRRVKNYRIFEKVITTKCLQRRDEEVKENFNDLNVNDYLPPYKTQATEGQRQAMVTMSDAVRLVNQYCQMLPRDSYTKLTPETTYKEIVTDSGSKLFVCTLQLPINCPIRDPIVSEPMPRKKLAQMASALKACELLHKVGELNDMLLPVSSSILTEDADTGKSGKPGAKRCQYYRKRGPKLLSESIEENQPSYLYAIEFHLVDDEHIHDRKVYPVEQTSQSFGIILTNKLPNIPEFQLYTRSGTKRVSLKLIRDGVILTSDGIADILKVHHYLFRSLLRIEKIEDVIEFNAQESECSITIVPMNEAIAGEPDIDWSFIKKVATHEKKDFLKHRGKFAFHENDWIDAVVARTYNYLDRPQYFYIAEIRKDLSPFSPFPSDNYSSFREYYDERYNLKIMDTKQPLLDVDRTALRLDMLTSRHARTSGIAINLEEMTPEQIARESRQTFFVPELCGRHIFPGSLWRQAVCLPSIMYRLTIVLNASELRSRIIRETGIGVEILPDGHPFPPLESGAKMEEQINLSSTCIQPADQSMDVDEIPSDNATTSDPMFLTANMQSLRVERRRELELIEKISLFNDYEVRPDALYGPSPGFILQALTTSGARDLFNLERMETIGDSFLKYAVTVYLYFQYPHLDEGKLTQRRMWQISNANLFRLGKEKGLAELMIAAKFEPCDNWLPPGYIVKSLPEVNIKVIDKRTNTEEVVKQHCMKTEIGLMDKNISDCVEALIGTYLVTCGIQPALKFMTWLGLKIDYDAVHELRSPILKVTDDWEDTLKQLTVGMDELENSIQYKFNNRGFLLQALTHASYPYNRLTECYQRLEFLGDAILDYIITRFLFEDSKRHSPGVLTDLRSALVNNNVFAKLAVQYKFFQSFHYQSSELYYHIDRFAQIIAEEESGKDFDEDVEAPKALGDIFESVAGAIYLDSGNSIETVWRVYYRMMKPLIEKFTITIPKAPVRELLEREPDAVKFEKPFITPEGKVRISVSVAGKGVYTGIGRNHRIARTSAARRALRALNAMEVTGVRVQ